MKVQLIPNKRYLKGLTAGLTLLLLAGACREKGNPARKTENYEVVGEGSAGGVTSTITGPGEQFPALTPSMTGTMADTTTDFTLRESVTSSGGIPSSEIPAAEISSQEDSEPIAEASPTPRNEIYFSKRPTPTPQPVSTPSGDPIEGDQMQEEEPTEQPPPPAETPQPDTNEPAEGDRPPSRL